FTNGQFVSISGTASVAQYEQLLGEIAYGNGSDAPSANAVREIQVSVSDGSHSSNVATAFVTVVPDNADAPVVDLDANDSSGATGANYQAAFTVGGGAIKVADTDLSVSDPDDSNLEGMTVQLVGGVFGGESVSLTVDGANLAASLGLSVFANGAFVSISGTATVAQYQQLLSDVVYDNTLGQGAGTVREIQVSFSDGTQSSNVATTLVTVQNTAVLDGD